MKTTGMFDDDDRDPKPPQDPPARKGRGGPGGPGRGDNPPPDDEDGEEREAFEDPPASEDLPELSDLLPFKLGKPQLDFVPGLDRDAARGLVDTYMSVQKVRIGAGNRVWSNDAGRDAMPREADIPRMIREQLHAIEKQTTRALQRFAESSPLGRWCLSNYGVGPVVTAGLLAHIDLARAQYAGNIYSFAGLLDPKVATPWLPGTKRPYNARLKSLCWNLGETFKRFSKRPECFYGQIYRRRKEYEIANNEAGKYADVARDVLERRRRKRARISPEQIKTWESGKLQPVGLDLRACRYAVKFFLGHYHAIGRELFFGETVKPWVIVHGGHHDYVPPPNWPMKE